MPDKERKPLFEAVSHDNKALDQVIQEASRYVSALILAAYRGVSEGVGVNADRLDKADHTSLTDGSMSYDRLQIMAPALVFEAQLQKAGFLDDMRDRVYELRGIIGRKLSALPAGIKWGVKKSMSPEAWDAAHRLLVEQMRRYTAPLAEELAVKGTVLGMASAHRDERNKRADEESYDDLERMMFAGYVPDTLRSATDRYDLGPDGIRELGHAHSRIAAAITSIPDDIRDAVRKQVLAAEREGKSVRELTSDLYHIKDDQPGLSGTTAEHRMRDWARVAQYELASAHSAGKAAATEDLSGRKPVHFVFGGSGKCDWCGPRQGEIVRQVPRSQVKSEQEDSLSAMGINDEYTDIAYWTGKHNIGLPKSMWRICWPAHNRCLSDDTEVLTGDGWKKFDDVHEHDVLPSLNPNSGMMEYAHVVAKISRVHDGKMVHFYNDRIDCLCTPDHMVPIYRPFMYGIELAEASRFLVARDKIGFNGEWMMPGPGLMSNEYGSEITFTRVEPVFRYTGRVVCLTLDINHIMLCRRNGTVFWTGNCGDTGTRIDPGRQEYDKETSTVRFKDEASADQYIPDDFLKELENERAKKRERLDRQEADRASGKHLRDARYYKDWRK